MLKGDFLTEEVIATQKLTQSYCEQNLKAQTTFCIHF